MEDLEHKAAWLRERILGKVVSDVQRGLSGVTITFTDASKVNLDPQFLEVVHPIEEDK